MSSSPSPTHESERWHAFTVALTVYSRLKKTMKGKASASKEVKSIKTKELLFSLRDNNYLMFLQSILEKHGQDQYKVLGHGRYPFKLVPPKAKGQCVNDTMDVDNEADYKEMVGKLRHNKSGTIKILVDMKQVERLPSSESGVETSDPSDGDDNLKSSSHGAADLDARLARWQIKLQQLHKNEQNEGFTYVGPMGPIPLTPAMILDWCHALEDGEAMLHSPPNLESFNMANKAMYLHPMCKVQALAQPPPPTTPPLDVNALTSVLLLQMLTKSGLLPSSVPATPSGQSILSPVTPPQANAEHSLSLPLIPSPTQLSRFLHFAEVNLGVCNATKYKVDLDLQGISPDILTEVDDKVLSDAGISVGSIICLKRGYGRTVQMQNENGAILRH
ncbi:hypothetical protein EDC04DRAFT_2892670 [Pisolithus marmoratus]|nr:hypothetical protein EDC04DRAFT_2892670 [Pisolithus marmoratus]